MTHHTPQPTRLRLLLVGGVSSRAKFSFIDYFCNVFIKRQKLSALKTTLPAA
jgi:hypothetical protein